MSSNGRLVIRGAALSVSPAVLMVSFFRRLFRVLPMTEVGINLRVTRWKHDRRRCRSLNPLGPLSMIQNLGSGEVARKSHFHAYTLRIEQERCHTIMEEKNPIICEPREMMIMLKALEKTTTERDEGTLDRETLDYRTQSIQNKTCNGEIPHL